MRTVRRVNAVLAATAVALLAASGPAWGGFVLSRSPAGSLTVGDHVTVTLSGTLSNIALLHEQVDYSSGLLSPDFVVDDKANCPASDAIGLLGSGVSGISGALVTACSTASGLEFMAIASSPFDTAGQDEAITNFSFLTAGSGSAVLNFKICAADSNQVCGDPGTMFTDSLTLQITGGTNIPEPATLALAATALLGCGLLRRREPR